MVPQAVAPPPSRRSWRLAAPHDAATQGLVVSAFGRLECASALFLHTPRGNAWLGPLLAAAPPTPAMKDDAPAAVAMAFTATGIARLGLPPAVMAGFAAPFLEGMHERHRARRLGDARDDGTAPVIAGGPAWSGNPPGAEPTPATVHAMLLLYARDDAALRALVLRVEGALATEGVEILRSLPLSMRRDATHNNQPREHFGFADGFSQPVPFGDAVAMNHDGQPWRDPWHGVPAGDFVLGHINAHGEQPPGPVVRDDPADAAAALLPPAAAAGLRDLARDGTYLVARELRQDVAAFWRSMNAAAATLGDPARDADWLAARVVGRERDGDLLTCTGPLPARDGMPENDIGFRGDDRAGLGCPIGSHIRRSNPRDGTGEGDGSGQLKASNNHRILRRGRKFGPEIADRLQDDGAERGLLFLCLNTDIARQFEFIQQTWLLNPAFNTLHEETDPLMGPAGPFTLPETPLRRRVAVETFVRFAGGEYFFLPSLPALRYFAALAPAD